MRAGQQAVASAQSHGPSPFQHPVEKQEYHGAAHRNRQAAQVETRDPSEPQLRSEVATHERAGDAEQDRDDQPAGVSAWHDDLGHYPRNQPEHNPRDESHDDSFSQQAQARVRLRASRYFTYTVRWGGSAHNSCIPIFVAIVRAPSLLSSMQAITRSTPAVPNAHVRINSHARLASPRRCASERSAHKTSTSFPSKA